MAEPGPPIVGWEIPDRAGRPGRRALGEVVGDVFGTYRRRFGAVVVLSLIFQGVAGVATAVVLAATLSPAIDYLGELWEWFGTFDPYSGTFAPEPLPPAGLSDPLVIGLASVATALPFAAWLFLEGAMAALLTARGGRPTSAMAALRATLRRWAPILLPVLVIAVGYALISMIGVAMTPRPFTYDPVDPPDELLLVSVVLSAVWIVILVAVVYLGIRWAVAVPAIVIEDIGLRAGLARSTEMTRGRRTHTFLVLLVVGILTAIVGWALWIVPLFVAIFGLVFGSVPLVAIAATLFVVVQILLGPLLPLAAAILYRDYRLADEAGVAAPTARP